jgi:hypothetical protein
MTSRRSENKGFILRALRPNGPYEGELLEVDAFFSRPRPSTNDWCSSGYGSLATELKSSLFLSQMTDWLVGLSEKQVELRPGSLAPERSQVPATGGLSKDDARIPRPLLNAGQ